MARGDSSNVKVLWKLASNPQLIKTLDKQTASDQVTDKIERQIKVILYFTSQELRKVHELLRDLQLTGDTDIVLINAGITRKITGSNDSIIHTVPEPLEQKMKGKMALFNNGYAVVIGVGADLPVTVGDANAIAQQLQDPARCAYPKDHIQLLTGENAERKNILSKLDWLAENAGPDDTVIVYFSGHGIEIPGFYLVPFGFDWSNLADTAISGQEFTEHLRLIKSKKLLVLLDCCHAGGQAEAKGHIESPLPSEAIAELEGGSGRVVIAACRKDEVSWTGQPYSQFTMAVLEALSGYGAFERDGLARVLDLALWVGRVIPERTDDKQHPIIKISNLQDNFALAWYAGGDQTPKNLPWIAVEPIMLSNTESSQFAAWQRMLTNYRENLLLIEERMSEYVEFTAIPLQLVKNKREIEARIAELQSKFG